MSSAVAVRENMLKRKRVVNPELTPEEARALEPCVASHDMGTKNYTFAIATRRLITAALASGTKHFPCPLKQILRWKKWILSGTQIMEYAISITEKLDNEVIHQENRVRLVLSEAQIAPKAKHMLGICASMMSYYNTRKLVTRSQYPEAFRCVGAQAKFSYCMLGTPEGDENYDNRKRLSRLIVEYLMNQWRELGLVEPEWVDFYNSKHITGDDKQDDYADCMLQLITELLSEMGVAPSWSALNAMFAWIIKRDSHFTAEGRNSWPLALSADGEKNLMSIMRKRDTDLLRAIKKQVKLKERLASLKRKKSPADEERLLQQAADDVERCQNECYMVHNELSTCISMIGVRSGNKEVRAAVRTKEREEADERKRKFDQLYGETHEASVIRRRITKARANEPDKLPYLMQLEHKAIQRGDAARLAFLNSAMGGVDDEVDFEEILEDQDPAEKEQISEFKRIQEERAKKARMAANAAQK